MSLFSLPEELLVDEILSHLSAPDLCAVRLSSRTLLRLADDSALWRRRLSHDFNFPAHATARVSGWKNLYAGLARPDIWTCGENADGRLGVDVASLPDDVKRIISWNRGAPFPLKVDWRKAEVHVPANDPDSDSEEDEDEVPPRQAVRKSSSGEKSLEVGAPVELHAAGWMFCALTSTGNVLWWGHLRTMGRQDWYNQVPTPRLLDLKGHKAKLLTCSESLVVLTQDDKVMSWSSVAKPIRLTNLFDLDEGLGASARRITQLASGSDFTMILTTASQPQAQQASSSSSNISEATDTAVYIWYNAWSQYGAPGVADEADAITTEADGSVSRSSNAVRLPDLPDPPADLAAALASDQDTPGFSAQDAASHPTHRQIVHVAGGENYMYALTASGLVYRLHVERPRAPSETFHDDSLSLSQIEEARTLLLQDFHAERRTWVLLRGFCDPAMIERAGGEVWKLPGKKDLIRPSTRITHLSATFRSFVAYSPAARSSEHDAPGEGSDEAKGGIVLIGTTAAETGTAPLILPALQGTGVIKVELGDYHWGALDAHGNLRTWGDWSKGAKGSWDSYDPDTSDRPAARGPRGTSSPFSFRIGLTRNTPAERRQSALQRRCRYKSPPNHEAEPRVVKFIDLDEDVQEEEDADEHEHEPGSSSAGAEKGRKASRYVYDFSMGGWHTGALSIDTKLLN